MKLRFIHSVILFFTTLYFASVPFESILALNGKTISRYLALLSSFFIIAHVLASKQITFKLDKIIILWGMFFLWALLSLIWTPYFEISIQSFWIHVRFFLFYCLLYIYSFKERELKRLFSFNAFSGIVAAIIIIYLYINNITYLNTIRASLVKGETSADPNHAAASLLLGLSFLINVIILNKKEIFSIKLFYSFAIVIIMFAIILTGSRAGLLGAITVIIMSLLYNKRNFIYLIRGILLMIFLIGIILYIREDFSQDLLKRYDLYEITSSGGAGRLEIWFNGIEIWKRKPVLGHGIGTFGEMHLVNAGIWKVAHNVYLQILVELGLIGVILFIITIWRLLYHREMQESFIKKGSQSAFIGMLVVSFFLGTLNYDYLWNVIYLLTASRNVQEFSKNGLY